MLGVYILLGFFIGSQTSKILSKKNTEQKNTSHDSDNNGQKNNIHDESEDNSNPGKHKIKVKKRMKKYFPIKSNSPEGIDPNKVSVNIEKKTQERNKSSPEQPNFIALSILWAHYVARQLGILKKDWPSPWEVAFSKEDGELLEKKAKVDISRDSWRNFLSNIIKDRTWTSWIKDPGEVKNRTLLAFNNM